MVMSAKVNLLISWVEVWLTFFRPETVSFCPLSFNLNQFCCRAAIRRAKAQLATFQQEAPAYPKHLFQGKGIVIMAGGLTYFVPAWINIHMLRKAGGCHKCKVHLCIAILNCHG